ncbi:MAG: GLUG motif-containing protein [Planctomycetota bacterium]|jgi:hypothetical protein
MLLVLVLLFSCNLAADVMIIYPSDDAYVDSNSPDDNVGSNDSMTVAGQDAILDGLQRCYLKFDLSSVPNTHWIVSGRLRIDCYARRGIDVNTTAHYLEDDAWDEATTTWNNAPTEFELDADDTTAVEPGDNYWTVTAAVRAAFDDDGILSTVLKLEDEDLRKGAILWSKEATDPNSWPYLEVETQAPILIRTAEDLNDIGKDPNNWDKYYLQVADINMANYTGTEFNVIGYWESMFSPNNVPFTGIFDGNDHAILNFTYQCADGAGIGLFGYIDDPNALIRDVTLIDPNIDAGNCSAVGALAGSLGWCTVSRCRVEGGNVEGSQGVGGLVGANQDGYITDCTADLNVSGTGYVGGLVGDNWQPITNSSTGGTVTGGSYTGGLIGNNMSQVRNCYSSANVSGDVYVGGLAGWNDIEITESFATGNVTGTVAVGGLVGSQISLIRNSAKNYATGNVQGKRSVGGLVGSQYGGTISQCYATGVVNGTEDVGGLAGSITHGHITNSYAAGAVVADSNVGGFAGLVVHNSTVRYCYESGPVTGTTNTGGFLGRSYGVYDYPSCESCFWDTDVNPGLDGIGNKTDANVIGKPTAEMQTKSTFTGTGWNFGNIWDICEGTNYPKLFWQIPTWDFACPDGANFSDYSFFARRWADEKCDSSDDCDGADLDLSGSVGGGDLRILCEHWLEATE